jgi:hypothetical protein
LPAPIAEHRNNPETESFSESYISEILGQFIDSLQRIQDVQCLDVGPVCEENILFFARRMKRLYICDMFVRLDRELRSGHHPGNVWTHLDYPATSFDGIQLWDLCDHLDDHEAARLLKLCHMLLKPEGLLMFVAFEEQKAPVSVNSFVIGPDYRIHFRRQAHLNLPWYLRHNRALMSLLTNFDHLKSFRYRSGLREFLLKKPFPFADKA